ncbi:hypothetical protein PpBr36_01964 [Pyricularia pennisetigena]|uniref:hypothetical protein n=1 Tax=Pyricularia pennisetigena TaxID=1578925 RepID=UPI00115377AD|nr:hypothetical protein PpBr36_01964 [Pyricularia pennisetigena]TLS29623.1 hypothetical protein PpBr36_01964 [Pyricularia pennisetigena]
MPDPCTVRPDPRAHRCSRCRCDGVWCGEVDLVEHVRFYVGLTGYSQWSSKQGIGDRGRSVVQVGRGCLLRLDGISLTLRCTGVLSEVTLPASASYR